MHTITLEKGLATFLNALSGKNRSAATIRAYQTDIQQFLSYLHETSVSIQTPADVEKVDIVEYLSSLAKRELTGIARARKMSALREYFRFLEGIGVKPRQHILYASGHLSRPEFSGENFRLERHIFPPNMGYILHSVMFSEK
jgi:site-specific recombinase XerD